jgi:hypothetical protein
MLKETPVIAMKRASHITLDPVWLGSQMDRFLGFEILTRTLSATYQPMAPERLADKIGADKGIAHKIIKDIQRHLSHD